MKIPYSKMAELLENSGVSEYRVSTDLNFSPSLFQRWKKGTSCPKHDKIEKISRYFHVEPDYFYGTFAHLKEYLEKVHPELKKEPVYEVAAGNGRINDGSLEMTQEVEEGHELIKICGDSMYPILQDGDIVKIRIQHETSKTDLSVVKVDGEAETIKYVEIVSNGIWLRAENKAVFEDKFYSIQDVMALPITIIGKATEIVSRKL